MKMFNPKKIEKNTGLFKVSFEEAHLLIEKERKNDDSEFMEGGFDPGTNLEIFLLQEYFEKESKLHELIEKAHLQELWNVLSLEKLLNRGLKFLSTGEMKKVLLFKAFLLLAYRKIEKIILIDLYDGLDFETVAKLKDLLETEGSHLRMRFPNAIEMEKTREAFSFDKETSPKQEIDIRSALSQEIDSNQRGREKKELVRMEKVNVTWSGVQVLKNIDWQLFEGEHSLILGPNGCGKTTLLELISGDNPQVYCNDVYIFGKKRGSGESIWDIKKQLGIVSYKLHLEYRLLGSISVENVLLSGLYDSIGLYDAPKESEKKAVLFWLALANMSECKDKNFANLSYGMQRAILILRSVIKTPRLLILDEPCHALSPSERSFVLALIEEIAKQSATTILHVSHDETEFLDCEKKIFRFLPETEKGYRIEYRS